MEQERPYLSNCSVRFCWKRKDPGVGNCYREEEQGLAQEQGMGNRASKDFGSLLEVEKRDRG